MNTTQSHETYTKQPQAIINNPRPPNWPNDGISLQKLVFTNSHSVEFASGRQLSHWGEPERAPH